MKKKLVSLLLAPALRLGPTVPALAIVDTSAAKTGKLISQGKADVDTKAGGVYKSLPAVSDVSSSSSSSGSSSSTDFKDVAPGAYYAKAVKCAVSKDITQDKPVNAQA